MDWFPDWVPFRVYFEDDPPDGGVSLGKSATTKDPAGAGSLLFGFLLGRCLILTGFGGGHG